MRTTFSIKYGRSILSSMDDASITYIMRAIVYITIGFRVKGGIRIFPALYLDCPEYLQKLSFVFQPYVVSRLSYLSVSIRFDEVLQYAKGHPSPSAIKGPRFVKTPP